ncbi:uncharacterized protein LOC141655023 [Silene latifolia]|uniref:uncharacterized protein LOC141655023 n=1 Tax=Silene latifolia TaxID=37657 RepID=UPI003D76EB79
MAIPTKKIMFLMITIAMVMVIALSSIHQLKRTTSNEQEIIEKNSTTLSSPPKRVSRFLLDSSTKNGRNNSKAADHCNKDNEVCNLAYGNNTTCCNNKCLDLMEDKHNCGACHNKCKFTQQCCGGECVDLSYDKRHCGSCMNKCQVGQYCIYGLCDYA